MSRPNRAARKRRKPTTPTPRKPPVRDPNSYESWHEHVAKNVVPSVLDSAEVQQLLATTPEPILYLRVGEAMTETRVIPRAAFQDDLDLVALVDPPHPGFLTIVWRAPKHAGCIAIAPIETVVANEQLRRAAIAHSPCN